MPRKQIFSEQEKQKFIELYRTGNYSYEEMTQFFLGRTKEQCRNFALNNGIVSGNRVFWTPEEDQKLKELCDTKKYSYNQMMEFLPGRDRKSIIHRVERLKLSNNSVTSVQYSYNENYFDEITVENCYWAGYFAADGCVYKKKNNMAFYWATAKKDLDQMKLFSSTVKSTYPLTTRRNASPMYPDRINDHYIFSTVRANRWAEKLKENFGIIQKKTKRFPPPNLRNNKEKLSYLVGYIDGDGTVCYTRSNKFSISIVSCNKELLIWMKDIIDGLNLPSLRESNIPQISAPKSENCYHYALSGFKAYILHEILIRLEIPRLKRKWNNEKVFAQKEIYKHTPDWPNELFFQNILNG